MSTNRQAEVAGSRTTRTPRAERKIGTSPPEPATSLLDTRVDRRPPVRIAPRNATVLAASEDEALDDPEGARGAGIGHQLRAVDVRIHLDPSPPAIPADQDPGRLRCVDVSRDHPTGAARDGGARRGKAPARAPSRPPARPDGSPRRRASLRSERAAAPARSPRRSRSRNSPPRGRRPPAPDPGDHPPGRRGAGCSTPRERVATRFPGCGFARRRSPTSRTTDRPLHRRPGDRSDPPERRCRSRCPRPPERRMAPAGRSRRRRRVASMPRDAFSCSLVDHSVPELTGGRGKAAVSPRLAKEPDGLS